jgi:hypothetical protein
VYSICWACSSDIIPLTSADYPVHENQKNCFAPGKTIVGLVEKIQSITCGIV